MSTTTQKLPWAGLLLLAVAGFLTMLTETVPAGVLGSMSQSLGVSEAAGGQLLTAYAAASMISAIPLVALTARLPRKPLVLGSVAGLALSNLAMAASTGLATGMAARVVGGLFAAIIWSVMAGYAMRTVAPTQQGRALAIAMGGIPLALALGVPLGSWLGDLASWRSVFLTMAAAGALVALAGILALPAVAGARASGGLSIARVLRLPGFVPLLVCAGAFQLGHMNLYTYIEPFLGEMGSGRFTFLVLLVLGVSSLAGLSLTGALIDKRLPTVAFTATGAFAVAMLIFGFSTSILWLIGAAILWGLGLGASPTIYQSAGARVSGPLVDSAQSVLVTVFNAGMAAGSAIGGAVLASSSASPLPFVSLAVFTGILLLLLTTRHQSLPSTAVQLHEDGTVLADARK